MGGDASRCSGDVICNVGDGLSSSPGTRGAAGRCISRAVSPGQGQLRREAEAQKIKTFFFFLCSCVHSGEFIGFSEYLQGKK